MPPVTQHQPINQLQPPYVQPQQPALPQPELRTHTVPDPYFPNHYRNVYNTGRMSPDPRPYMPPPQMPAYFPFQGGRNQQL